MIEDLLIRHEGLRLKPYRCSEGKLTIGVGRNLDDNGITEEEALALLRNDIESCKREASQFPWYEDLSNSRKDVIISMIFNLGLYRFSQFKNMIKALENEDFEEAAYQMLDSKWASQVGNRAVELSKMMEN
jgi:lysozyme